MRRYRNNPIRYTDSTGHWIDQGCGCTGNTRIAAPKPIVKGGPLVGNSDIPFKPAPKTSTTVTVTGGGSGGSAAGGGAGGSNGGRRPGGRGGGSGSTANSSTAVQGDNQPSIDMSGFVNALLGESTPVSGNGPLAGFTPVTINDLGFEILDPAPTWDKILFAKKGDSNKDKGAWDKKKPKGGKVKNPDGTTTEYEVRNTPGADGGWSRIVKVRDANGNTILVVHEAWNGTSDPRVDPPDHRDIKFP